MYSDRFNCHERKKIKKKKNLVNLWYHLESFKFFVTEAEFQIILKQ